LKFKNYEMIIIKFFIIIYYKVFKLGNIGNSEKSMLSLDSGLLNLLFKKLIKIYAILIKYIPMHNK